MQTSALYEPTFDEIVEYGRPEVPLPRRKRHLTLVPDPRDNPPFEIQNSITRDQSLGSNTANNIQNVSITTTNAAASGSRVVVCFGYFQSPISGTPTCTVGGTSATLDKQNINGLDVYCVFSLVVASGLASNSTITCSMGSAAGTGGALAGACSYLGTTGVDTTSSNTTTGTGLSSGAAANAIADALFVGGAGNETIATSVGGTNTNGTMRFDLWQSAAQQGIRMLDLIVSSTGSQALTGTWASSSTATTGALVVYSGTGPQPITYVTAMDMMRARTL